MWRDVQQNSDEWLAMRLGKVTASGASLFMANLGKAFGEPAKKYAVELALQRVTGKASETYTNPHMERGHEQEPFARALYEETCFANVGNGGFFDYGDYGCSPDGLISKGAIEIKSVIASVHYANLKRGKFDPSYTWQLASLLDCDGIEFVDFCSFCPDFPDEKRLLIYRVQKEQMSDEIKSLKDRRSDFLQLVESIEIEIRS